MVYLLHISDLHLVVNPLWNNMKYAILYSVRKKVHNIPVGEKLLVITGDLHNFIENNYDQAMEFLPKLFEAMGIEADKDVFVIPGNHDVANDIPDEVDREVIIQAVESNPKLLHRDRVEQLLLCYDQYIELVKAIKVYKSDCDNLPVQVHVRTWRDKLHLLHLNTSLVSAGGGKKKQLTDTNMATSDEIRNRLEAGSLPCIAIGHHSFFDLSDKQQEELSGMFQQENISAYLCGDRHQRNKTREENRIPLSPGISSISIPHIVSYRTSTDENDQYSDFGMIWHIWNEKTGHVELEFMKWDVNHQSELQPDRKDSYEFRNDLYEIPAPSHIPVKGGENSAWLSKQELADKGSAPVKPAQIRGFLLGGRCGWNLAFSDDCIVERNIVDTLYQYALDGGVYALTGPGGEGKSTALMQLCKKLVCGGNSVFYYRGRGKIELPGDIMEDSILIVDNPPDSNAFKYFLEDVTDNGYTLILGVRENEWNLLKKSLGISNRDVRDIPMQKLTPKESWTFADCVCNNLRHFKSRAEIKDIFLTRSYGFLYAAMLLAVSDKDSLEEIAHQIIVNLAKKYRNALLLLAHIVFSEQYKVRFSQKQFNEVCNKLGMSRQEGNHSLSREISLNGEIYQTRHEVISKLFFRELFSESGLLEPDEIDDILTNLIYYHLNYYNKMSYGRHKHNAVKSVMELSGGLAYAGFDTQQYLFGRILDEIKSEPSETFDVMLSHIKDKDTQLVFYRVCFDRGEVSSNFLGKWCHFLMKNGTPWTLNEPYSPSWIMREACINRGAGAHAWRKWILLEKNYGRVGDYDSENTARWICRKICMEQKGNSMLWQIWGDLEEQQGNIGDYAQENSARWIYRKACMEHGAKESVWQAWRQLEEKQDNIGDYNEENSVRWIYRVSCLSRKVGDSAWHTWAELEEKLGNIGDYTQENSARWIYRKACMEKTAKDDVWKAWGELEERQGNIGYYGKMNSARWIYRKACIDNEMKGNVWRAWGELEEREGNVGDYSIENSARWIYKTACDQHRAGRSVWLAWGALEEREENTGDYNTKNSARWIYRKACINSNANDDVWLAWGRMEENEGNIGDYDTENSARWIYHEAYIRRKADKIVWLAWGRMEENEGNIGDYDTENSARWIYRRACIDHEVKDNIWKAWGELEEREGNVGDYSIENSARWIYKTAFAHHRAGSGVWKAWGELEEREGNVGDYSIENSTRWIYRKACINSNANDDVWLTWGKMEENEGNIGDYDTENSARWIYHEAYIRRKADKDVWLAWGRVEENEGNIGDYDTENSARWIYREACIRNKAYKDVWLAWGRMEENEGNIGDYDTENSARWIYHEFCFNRIADRAVWLAWGLLEERQGNIGDCDTENSARWIHCQICNHADADGAAWLIWGRMEERQGNIREYDKENSARWIYAEGIKRFPDFMQTYFELANMEVSQCCMRRARIILQNSLQYSDVFSARLAIIEFFYGNIDSEDDYCVKKLIKRAESRQSHSRSEIQYLYHCYSLLGQTEDAEHYRELLTQYPDYDCSNLQVESFVQQCQKAASEVSLEGKNNL